MGPRNYVLDGCSDPPIRRAILRGNRVGLLWSIATCCHELCKNGWTNWDAIWYLNFGRPKKACIRWGAHSANLANTIEPFMCSGDVACCQVTLPTCYILLWRIISFWFAHFTIIHHFCGTVWPVDVPFRSTQSLEAVIFSKWRQALVSGHWRCIELGQLLFGRIRIIGAIIWQIGIWIVNVQIQCE